MDSRITFEFTSEGRMVTIARPNYSILDYDGLESSDYSIESEDNINGIGARKKRTKILKRQVMIEFE